MYIDLYKIEISAAQFNNDHLRSEITKLREQVKDYEVALNEVGELKEWCSAEGGFYKSSEVQKQLKSIREVLKKLGCV